MNPKPKLNLPEMTGPELEAVADESLDAFDQWLVQRDGEALSRYERALVKTYFGWLAREAPK